MRAAACRSSRVDSQADGPTKVSWTHFFLAYGPRQWTGLVLGPGLFFGLGLGLQSPELTPAGRWTAATVALMSTWWITQPLPLWATAVLPVLIFPVAGVTSLFGVVIQYFDPINFLFLGGMLIAAAMQQWGLHRRIALAVIARIGTEPRRIVLGFMLATGFITLWISNTATAMMMFPIGMAVLWKFQEETGANDPLLRRFGLALMLGIAYAASIGGIGTKIGTPPNLVFVKHAGALLQLDVDFLSWLKVALPIVLISLPLVWLYLVRVAAPLPAAGFAAGRETVARERARLGVMNPGERVALVAFLSAAFLWIFRKDIELGTFTIPGWWRWVGFGWDDVLGRPLSSLPEPLAKLLAQDVGDAAVAIVIGTLLFLVPVSRRPVRFTLGLGCLAGVGWGVLVLFGGGLAMAYGIQQSGLSAWVAGVLQDAGHLNPFVATLMVCLLATALTEVASNVATASILLPLIAASAESFGVHPAPLMFAATCSASFGLMLPAGTPPNAIVFSSGYITVPQMARSGVVVDLAGAVLVATVCYFLAAPALGLR
jgi:sodium-dependent dicarboxylate transporter 2/3/5